MILQLNKVLLKFYILEILVLLMEIVFLCSNLIDRVGEPIAIIYDSTHDNKEWSEEYWAEGDAYIKYSYAYEPLGDNWYYDYINR